MPLNPKKHLSLFYARVLTIIAPVYRHFFKTFKKPQGVLHPKRIVLLVSRPQDVELLIGIHEKAKQRREISLCFWVVKSCARRYPEVLTQLEEKEAEVEQVVSFTSLGMVLCKLMRSDAFLSTVESTRAKRKLPYIIAKLANAASVSTYTLQHGFPNIGINYCDHIYGPEIRFAAKTVFIWGSVEALPPWVSKDTRHKCVAVGCPKELVLFDDDLGEVTSERPIIAIFESFHGHIYNMEYITAFLSHLQKTAKQRKEFRFIFKSHPASLRCRSKELSKLLSRLEDVEIVDSIEGKASPLTTPWLLTHASGVITSPSTVALDGALVGVPVAVARYGLDLPIYSPLTMLDNNEDWGIFLGKIEEGHELKQKNEEFLRHVIVPGDATTRILDFMSGHSR